MGGLYAPFKIYTPGEVLTAADFNATDQNHITNQMPQMTDDYSIDLTQKRLMSDPANTLATSLAIEIQQLRWVIAKLGGKTFWDEVTGPVGGSGGGGSSTVPRIRMLRGLAKGAESRLQLDADVVTFSGGTTKLDVSALLDIARPGPALNGRDQDPDLLNTWVNIWWIYNPTTTVVGLTATAKVDTTDPPALPSGFTEYCYATSLRVDAIANQWLKGGSNAQIHGSYVSYEPNVQVVTASNIKAETGIDITKVVPVDRIIGSRYKMGFSNLGGGNTQIRVHTTVNFRQINVGGIVELTLPVADAGPWYLKTGSGTFSAWVNSYQVPNTDV